MFNSLKNKIKANSARILNRIPSGETNERFTLLTGYYPILQKDVPSEL
jgi:hypothetical protein